MKLPNVDAVFVVAVSGSTRAEPLLADLTKHGLDFELFDAFDGRALHLQTDVRSTLLEGATLPVGRLANYLSQVAIFREAHRRKLGNVLIFEEDARLCSCFWEHAPHILEQLPQSAAMLYLGALDWNKQAARVLPNSPFMRPGRPILRHAVLHTAHALPYLIERTRTLSETIDVTISSFASELEILATIHRIAYQASEPNQPEH